MNNYDLLTLSWIEFEDLIRDLLQCEFNIFIESFTTGKDSGIDLRFALTKDRKSIVQCKRINTYNSLYSQLKKEKEKIVGKQIDRYYIATTVGLTPKAKTKIYELFQPIIKDESDIFGKDDIINLISRHPNIETKYYKLWITSTTVLNKILNANIYNYTEFQSEQIKKDAKIYVHNESYDKALKILEENHYIIISGIPGIGKTTLAKMLVYDLIASGINNLTYLSSNIYEAYKTYNESLKQVFYFDDFLGRNLLENKLNRNEDQQLIDFIKKIKDSKNKYFIMTTREYILKQAQQKYELLNKYDINIAKCIIDIAQYTLLVRGKILYRHLYFSNIPKNYLQELVKDQRYLEIINHRNYNPRIIENIINNRVWNEIPIDNFYFVFSSYFDNPESIWIHAFENQISKLSRVIIIILGSINDLVELDKLKYAVKYFCFSDNTLSATDFTIDFNKSLKELSDSFIKIDKFGNNIDAIEYHNPSVSDFIHSYLRNNTEITKSVIEKCVCLDQIITIYQIFQGSTPDEIRLLCENKIHKSFDKLNIIKLNKSMFYKSDKPLLYSDDNSKLSKLCYITRNIFPLLNNDLIKYLIEVFYAEWKNIISDSSYTKVVDIYLSFNEYNYINCYEQFIEELMKGTDSFYKLLDINRLKDIDLTKFEKVTKTEATIKIINNIADYEYRNTDIDNLEYTRDNMIDISEYYGIDLDSYIADIENRIEEHKNHKEQVEVHKINKTDDSIKDQAEQIKELFETLLLK